MALFCFRGGGTVFTLSTGANISCWIVLYFGLVAMENNDSPMDGIRRYVIIFTEGKFAIVATIFLRLHMLV